MADDAGMVSVEAAIATGSLVAVLALVLAAMSAVILQLRCVDAAGEAARLASRGDVDGARRAALRLVPEGGGIVVTTRGEDVTVRVEVPPLGSALPGLRVGATARAAREPDTASSGEPGGDSAPDPGGGPPSPPPIAAPGSPPATASDPSGGDSVQTPEPLPARRPP